jgi:pyruvate formate lyase activating enzyme
MKNAMAFDIQRFSVHDGPGIRTLIFFKGCSLACAWCSNPEGISAEPELSYKARLCVGCGECLRACPAGAISAAGAGMEIDRQKCRKCGSCVAVCANGALEWRGVEYTVERLSEIARRDQSFYAASGGGVTLGGGDPLLQNEQAVALLRLCKENGLNTAIETAGNYPWAYLENAAPYCDTIHFDIKAWREETCRAWTGGDISPILANLRRLDEWIAARPGNAPKLVARVPLLPDENFSEADFSELAAFLGEFRALSAVEILPLHNLGQPKYEQLGKPYRLKGRANLKAADVAAYEKIFVSANLPVRVITI